MESENRQLKNENKQLTERFERFLSQQTFMALMQPGHGAASLRELCARLQLDPAHKKFLLVELFNDSVLSREDRVPLTAFQDQELTVLIDRILRCMTPVAQTLVVPFGDRLLCLLVFPDTTSDEGIYKTTAGQIHLLNHESGVYTLYAAVSHVVSDVREFPAAFTEVKQLADYKTIMKNYAGPMLFAAEHALRESGSSTEEPVSPEQRQFVFFVQIGAFREAGEAAHQLCRKRLLEHTTAETLPLAMASLKDNFIHFLGSSCMELKLYPVYQQLGTVQRITEAATVQQLVEELDAVLEALDAAFSGLSPAQSLPQRMKSYVDENFSNPDVNVNAVANFFDISPAYATKLFRNAYHMGLLDYIHQRRIFSAKELLGSGRSIAEIAERSGYGTSSNMIRAFKRIEGMTPGQLAAMEQEKSTETVPPQEPTPADGVAR